MERFDAPARPHPLNTFMQQSVISYLESQRRPSHWDVFLNTVAASLQDSVAPEALRALMRDAGMRAGRKLPLPACESLEQMQSAANEHWSAMGWGYVSVEDQADHVAITHVYAPFKDLLGAESYAWSGGFLEGVYQQWFMLLGAGEDLKVRQVGSGDGETLSFLLAR